MVSNETDWTNCDGVGPLWGNGLEMRLRWSKLSTERHRPQKQGEQWIASNVNHCDPAPCDITCQRWEATTGSFSCTLVNVRTFVRGLSVWTVTLIDGADKRHNYKTLARGTDEWCRATMSPLTIRVTRGTSRTTEHLQPPRSPPHAQPSWMQNQFAPRNEDANATQLQRTGLPASLLIMPWRKKKQQRVAHFWMHAHAECADLWSKRVFFSDDFCFCLFVWKGIFSICGFKDKVQERTGHRAWNIQTKR